jgi:hypothetical protein
VQGLGSWYKGLAQGFACKCLVLVQGFSVGVRVRFKPSLYQFETKLPQHYTTLPCTVTF